MTWLFPALLANTAVGIVLAVLALLASRCGKPALAHVIWLLVVVKLITPPMVRMNVWKSPPAAPSEVHPAIVLDSTSRIVVAPRQEDAGSPRRSMPSAHVEKAAPARTIDPPNQVPAQNAVSHDSILRRAINLVGGISIFALLVGIGCAGSLTYLGVVGARLKRFCSLLKQAAPAERGIVEKVQALCGTMEIARLPDVCVVNANVSPMLFALQRTTLVLPRSVVDRFSMAQQRAVIAHELAHLRRGDHFVRWFEILATTLLWWHPLLWLARHGLHEAEEQCCDAWVVATMTHDEHDARGRREYADALVDVLELTCLSRGGAGAGKLLLPAAASGLGRMTNLKRRLAMILADRTPQKSMSWSGKLVVAMVGAALLPLSPVRGGNDSAKPGASPTSAAPSAARGASSLPAVDESTRKAIESLLETAQDENDQVKMAAVGAVTRFGPKAVPVLIDALGRDKEAPLAQSLLSQMGIDGMEGLLETIDSPAPPAVRERALLAVEGVLRPGAGAGMGEGGMAPAGFAPPAPGGPPGAAPGNFGAAGAQPLINPSPTTMSFALWSIAPAARASADSNAAVRRAAVRVLGAISSMTFDPAVAKALAASMKDEDATVRRVAAGAMVNVARFAPEVASTLIAAVNDSDQSVRVSAINALGSLGSRAKQSMPVLTAALKDPDPSVRIAAANALGAMQIPQQFNVVAAAPNAGANDFPPGGMPPTAAPNPDGSLQFHDFPMPPAPGSPEVWIYAQNVWHWAKLGRYDQAKTQADRIIKTDEATLLDAFSQVAQERNENLEGWLKRNADVKEMKELVSRLNEAIEHSKPAGGPEGSPGSLPYGGAAGGRPPAPSASPK